MSPRCLRSLATRTWPKAGRSAPPDRSAPRLGLRFAVGTGHLCQIKFWLIQVNMLRNLRVACGELRMRLGLGGKLDDAYVFSRDGGATPYRPAHLGTAFK